MKYVTGRLALTKLAYVMDFGAHRVPVDGAFRAWTRLKMLAGMRPLTNLGMFRSHTDKQLLYSPCFYFRLISVACSFRQGFKFSKHSS